MQLCKCSVRGMSIIIIACMQVIYTDVHTYVRVALLGAWSMAQVPQQCVYYL